MAEKHKCWKTYCCFHPNDKAIWDELRDNLASLTRTGYISLLSDLDISPGEHLVDKRSEHINSSDLILLLSSQYFLADDECYAIAERARARYQTGQARVVLVLAREVYYDGLPIVDLPQLPKTKAIVSWSDRQKAFV